MNEYVVTITRTCGSGGSTIANMLAKEMGIKVYNRELLKLASYDSGINESIFAQADEDTKKSLLYKISKKTYCGEIIPPESDDFTSNDNLFNYQAKVLKELAKKEPYIVVGRGADYILRYYEKAIKVYIFSTTEKCINHEMHRLKICEREAEKLVLKTNIYRANYYRYHTGRKWKDVENYDLVLNTSMVSYREAVELIKRHIEIISLR